MRNRVRGQRAREALFGAAPVDARPSEKTHALVRAVTANGAAHRVVGAWRARPALGGLVRRIGAAGADELCLNIALSASVAEPRGPRPDHAAISTNAGTSEVARVLLGTGRHARTVLERGPRGDPRWGTGGAQSAHASKVFSVQLRAARARSGNAGCDTARPAGSMADLGRLVGWTRLADQRCTSGRARPLGVLADGSRRSVALAAGQQAERDRARPRPAHARYSSISMP